jgi:diaminopimelate epimerase
MLKFHKYQGTGNDFVMIDGRENLPELSQHQIVEICQRRFGIGADGLIVLTNAEGYDFRMIYYNADGNEGSMCGNGGRCTVKFAHDLKIFDKKTRFIAVDGPHEAELHDDIIHLKMSDTPPVQSKDGVSFYNTGSPHIVLYVDDLENEPVDSRGRQIRYSEYWKSQGGTNVNFVEIIGNQSIKVRTYERGVEAETYSCGTGVTACALDAYESTGMLSPIAIETRGGNLNVSFEQKEDRSFKNIWLQGPAKKVYDGQYPLSQ